jgi:hypothetical protein
MILGQEMEGYQKGELGMLNDNSPPRIGPTILDTPNILERAAMYKGRLRRGTAKATIVMPKRD